MTMAGQLEQLKRGVEDLLVEAELEQRLEAGLLKLMQKDELTTRMTQRAHGPGVSLFLRFQVTAAFIDARRLKGGRVKRHGDISVTGNDVDYFVAVEEV